MRTRTDLAARRGRCRPSVRSPAERALDGLDEAGQLERLGEVVLGAAGLQALRSACGVASADRMITGMSRIRSSRAQAPQHLLAVDVGQVEVEQDQVGRVLARRARCPAGPAWPTISSSAAEPLEDPLDERRGWRGCPRCRGRAPPRSMRRGNGVRLGLEEEAGVVVRVLGRAAGRRRTSSPRPARCARRRSRRPSPRPAARERQAEAGALDVGRVGAEPLERQEQRARARPRAMPAAGVGDSDSAARRSGIDVQRDAHRPARPVVLDGVGEEVEQHLLEALAVGQHELVAARRGVLLERDRRARRPAGARARSPRSAAPQQCTGSSDSGSRPASMREMSSTSLISVEQVAAGADDAIDAVARARAAAPRAPAAGRSRGSR